MNEEVFLIVMTKSAIKSLQGKIDSMEERLLGLSDIRLYKILDKKKRNERDWMIALPLSGEILMLRRDENENYFICVHVMNRRFRPPDAMAFYFELGKNVRARIVDSGKTAEFYDSVNCYDIERQIENKEIWDMKGGDYESDKWRAYIDLHKEQIKNQRFKLAAIDYEKKGKFAEVTVEEVTYDLGEIVEDENLRNKIEKARGERVDYSFGSNTKKYSFGALKSFNKEKKRIIVSLDDKFDNFQKLIEREKFYAPLCEKFSEIQYTTIKFGSAKSLKTFYYDLSRESPAFDCLAECVEPGIWQIEPHSIKPRKMALFADFNGEMYQLKVMKRALNAVKNLDIWGVLSEERVSKMPLEVDSDIATHLNENQQEAVKKALGAQELCLIWGPPGTGKREVIMEIARQGCLLGRKTLIVSQANLAVDNALARLHNLDDVWTFRLVASHKLEHEDRKKVPVEGTAGEFFAERLERLCISNDERWKSDDIVVSELRLDLVRRLKREIRSKDRLSREIPQLAKLYHRRINVVGATLMETGKVIKGDEGEWKKRVLSEIGISEYDTVIVDEVSKALPTELFVPILLAKRVVLVGDQKQLPPMLKLDSGDFLSLEKWAEEVGVSKEEIDTETTLFEKLWEKHKRNAPRVCQMLTTQYRMHPNIQQLIEPFYEDIDGGSLECGLEKEAQDEMRISLSEPFNCHAMWVDTTTGSDEEKDGTSYFNPQEIQIVGDILERLPKKDLEGKDLSVGVITFYGAQLRRLRDEYETKYSHKFLDGRLIFGTVDRFQGRENDIIICSLVRKNEGRKIGFAVKPNRINVAFSRARRLLCIVGNSEMFRYKAGRKEARDLYSHVYKNCLLLSRKNIVE